MTIRGFAIFCVVVGIVGLTAIFSIERFKQTCERNHYDWTNPPRICRLGCADGEVWSRQAKMCVLSCPAGGCV